MNESDTLSSYTVVEPINDDTPLPDLNSLLGILKRMRDCEGADGLPWPENDVSPGRPVSLARTERALVGLLTVLEVPHSAERCRVAAEPERHLDEAVVDGLFLACRELAECAAGGEAGVRWHWLTAYEISLNGNSHLSPRKRPPDTTQASSSK